MLSFVNRMGLRLLKRALVFALAGAVLSGILTVETVAARENRTPYVIPGDSDGPLGTQEAVASPEKAGSDVLPLYLPVGPWTSGPFVVRVDSNWRAVWFGPGRAKTVAAGHPKR